MTHYNPMKGSGYTERDVPPSQDLDEDDPTVYQVKIVGHRNILSFDSFMQGNTWNWKATSKLKLQFYGNERTMNLNPLILANVQGSPYFKVVLDLVHERKGRIDNCVFRMSCLR